MVKQEPRADHAKGHRAAYQKNKRKIMRTRSICAICGKPVDFTLNYPHPMSATVDHIIPISKGGHPSDIDNLQLAHFSCNRQKSDKLFVAENKIQDKSAETNRDLPWSIDWTSYRSE